MKKYQLPLEFGLFIFFVVLLIIIFGIFFKDKIKENFEEIVKEYYFEE
jgi:uncharacterized protein (UPF0333 family)